MVFSGLIASSEYIALLSIPMNPAIVNARRVPVPVPMSADGDKVPIESPSAGLRIARTQKNTMAQDSKKRRTPRILEVASADLMPRNATRLKAMSAHTAQWI